MRDYNVHRILVDNRSSVNLLNFQAFKQMGLHEKDLRPITLSIYGFTGDVIASKGMIKLPITLGTALVVAKSMADFAVIDQYLAYNAVIGRSFLKGMKIVTSIYHLTMKFPTPAGIGSVRGIQSESQECYNTAVKLAEKKSINVIYLLEAPPPRQEVFRIEEVPHKDEPDLDPRILDYAAIVQAAKDTIEVPIDPVDNNKILKIGATYQRLVNMMFADLIGDTMEVYVDDMLVKSQHAEDHVNHLQAMFEILRRYKMRLNPLKCVFGVGSGKFLGFMANQRGIEANPVKIKALVETRSPTKPKEVQSLTGKVVALNHFISQSSDKCNEFFKILKGNKKFQWTEKCEEAFQALKMHLGQPPILSKPISGEVLSVYLAVSEYAISSVLIREDQGQQYPVYYVSKRLLDAETRYPQMEKLAFALVISSRKLRPYFQAHSIEVLTNYPLRQVLAKPEASGRLLKWSVELSQFDISTEVALVEEKIDTAVLNGEGWTLYVDGASNSEGSSGGIILISPKNFKVHAALCFEFSASNNEAEYEALIAGLKLALKIKIEYLQAFSDSQIVVCQVNREYLARGGRLAKYLAIVCELLQKFKKVVVSRVPRAHNSHADTLARLASTREAKLLDVIPVDVLAHPTVSREEVMEIDVAREVTWMTLIIAYLEKVILPDEKIEARKLLQQAAQYVIYDGRLYCKSFSQPLLKCIDGEDCGYILCEVHGGICGNHTGGNSLALKIMRQRYYWPTLRQDAFNFAKKCNKCQRIATYVHQPPSHLHSITSPWPFIVWGIDLIGELPKGKGGVKYAVVAVDYFTKWAEAKALATITAAKLREFFYNSIIC
ncbi:uncharacterized protein LOC133035241 [Cannabis sativa]|uniref:uncharacterized protein LOC133035241 n=1 Tax=Cannabis sativa TaxID=3483 RepID=UPI0029CA6DF3|nr:uncharacterized protein LOC133035241 [Cannabis sativa]